MEMIAEKFIDWNPSVIDLDPFRHAHALTNWLRRFLVCFERESKLSLRSVMSWICAIKNRAFFGHRGGETWQPKQRTRPCGNTFPLMCRFPL